MYFDIPIFIEVKERGWKVYQANLDEEECYQYNDYSSGLQKKAKTDPMVAELRTHTELLQGSELLLENCNLLNFDLVEGYLENYLLGHVSCDKFIEFATGYCFFSYNQMLNSLDYSEYNGFVPKLLSITEKIITATMGLLAYQDIVFCEKGKQGVSKAWAELGKLTELIFSDPNLCEDYKLCENLNMLKPELDKYKKIIFYYNIKAIILNHLKKGSCLRFFYSFKRIISFIQYDQNEELAETFLNYLSMLQSDIKYYDLDICLELLCYFHNAHYDYSKIRKFLTINLDILTKSEKLIQKKRILEYVCSNLYYDPELPLVKEVLIKCFDHECLPNISIALIEIIIKQGGFTQEDFKEVYESINDNVVLIEYFKTFVNMLKLMRDDLVFNFLRQINSSQFEGKENMLKLVIENLVSRNISLEQIGEYVDNFDLIIKSLPYKEPYLIETRELRKYTGVNSQNEKVIEVLGALVESCDKDVFKSLDEKLSISDSLLFQLQFEQSIQNIKKTAETLNTVLNYHINNDQIIGYVFQVEKIFKTLAEYLFEWTKNDIIDNYIERIHESIQSLLAEKKPVSLDVMFNVYKKLHKSEIKYYKSVVLSTDSLPIKGLENLLFIYLTQGQSESDPEILNFIVRIGRTSKTSGQEFFNSFFESLIGRKEKIRSNKMAELVFLLAGVDVYNDDQVKISVESEEFHFRGSDTVDEVKVCVCEKLGYNVENAQFNSWQDARFARDIRGKNVDITNKKNSTYSVKNFLFSDKITSYLFSHINIDYIIKYMKGAQVKNFHLEMSLFEALPYINSLQLNESSEEFYIVLNYMVRYLKFPLISQYFLCIFTKFIQIKKSKNKNELTKFSQIVNFEDKNNLLTAFFTVSQADNSELDISPENKIDLDSLKLKIDSEDKLNKYLDSILKLKKNCIINEKYYFSINLFSKILKKFDSNKELTPLGEPQFFTIIQNFFNTCFVLLLEREFFEEFFSLFELFSQQDKLNINFDFDKKLKENNEFKKVEVGYTLRNYTILLKNTVNDNDLTYNFIYNFLFNVDFALFKSVDSRKEAIFLFFKLCENPNVIEITNKIKNIDNCKYFNKALNNQSQLQNINFLIKGIRNHGNTCYINSVLQLLLLINPIIKKILCYKNDNAIFKVFQHIFLRLKFSILPYVRSRKLVKTFLLNGQKINLGEQLDAAEFLAAALELIEKNLGKSDLNRLKLAVISETKCCACNKMVREPVTEDYYVVPLDIIGKESVEDCFSSFFSSNIVYFPKTLCCNSGYFVSKKLNHFHSYLVLSLSRFSFNNSELKTEKMYQKIRLKDNLQYNELRYRLICFIVHIGTAENGHYVTFIKKDIYWVLLNDEKVTYYNEKNFDLNNFFMLNEALFINGDISTPYLLLYKKQKSKPKNFEKYKNSEIQEKNKMVFECFTLFSPDFVYFIQNLVRRNLGIELAVDYLLKIGFFLENSALAIENLLMFLKSNSTEKSFIDLFSNSKNFDKLIRCFLFITDNKMINLFESALQFAFYSSDSSNSKTMHLFEYIQTFDHKRLDFSRILNFILQESKNSKNQILGICEDLINYHIQKSFSGQVQKFNVFIIIPTNFSFLYEFISQKEEILIGLHNLILKNFNNISESMINESEFYQFFKITKIFISKNYIGIESLKNYYKACLGEQKFDLVLGFLKNVDEEFERFCDLIEVLIACLTISKYRETIEVLEKMKEKCISENFLCFLDRNLVRIKQSWSTPFNLPGFLTS